MIDRTAAHIEAYLENPDLDVKEMQYYTQQLAKNRRHLLLLQESVLKVARVVKIAVEINNTSAQDMALAMLAEGVDVMRSIIMEHFSHADHQLIHEEFERRIMGKGRKRREVN
jgi:nitric oxide synthase oxygenase domain/subunit